MLKVFIVSRSFNDRWEIILANWLRSLKASMEKKVLYHLYRDLFRMFTLQEFLACSKIPRLCDVQRIQIVSLCSRNFWYGCFDGDELRLRRPNLYLWKKIDYNLLNSRAPRSPNTCAYKTTSKWETTSILQDATVLLITKFSKHKVKEVCGNRLGEFIC